MREYFKEFLIDDWTGCHRHESCRVRLLPGQFYVDLVPPPAKRQRGALASKARRADWFSLRWARAVVRRPPLLTSAPRRLQRRRDGRHRHDGGGCALSAHHALVRDLDDRVPAGGAHVHARLDALIAESIA